MLIHICHIITKSWGEGKTARIQWASDVLFYLIFYADFLFSCLL